MHLTRRQSRTIALSGAALVFLFLCSLLWRREVQQGLPVENQSSEIQAPTPQPSTVAAEDSAPKEPSVTLEKFHRVETKNGKTVWEVRADRGSYAPQSNSVTVDNATLWLFKDEKKAVELTAPHAKLNLEGTTLLKAIAYDGVKVRINDQITTTTETAEFDRSSNTITAPGPVTIEHTRMTIKGRLLKVNLDTQLFELGSDVDTVVLPEP